ncbi:PTS glucitol/sorbitol transporter subunit IIA [Lactiplantibacillus sp. WILCCON 0030]|uniref:PTS glucitol/sorbitol transporter subunit IIA n=2 Tax=Lactiplantibacillus brownii TaxID=3069269 RepID=A0ABU1A9P3_9LACO|nr:PTS glucitol/sorbitol transporter subunit IIA [Lactiplantibacillus brownii]MDQ7937647.1 PTS glucitol/sorbitol transporter subunit IIA [Lactiplantibacillus brownii]
MTTTATVKAIGPQAVSPDEPILILFDETATASLQQIAVIQQFNAPLTSLSLHVGSTLKIDDQAYTMAYVGPLVGANLATIGHATLYFTAVPAKPLANGIYLTPTNLPTIKVGSVITYEP